MINLIAVKIHQLHNLIDWINVNHSSNINKLPFNEGLISNDSWLAGFVDALAGFYIRNSNRIGLKRKIACRLRIEHIKYDPLTGQSYEPRMLKIARFFGVSLIEKEKNNNFYLSITVTSKEGIKVIKNYLDSYPLLSSKYLDYLDWLTVANLILSQTEYNEENSILINKLKSGMNKNRKIFKWDHLKDLMFKPSS